MPENAGTVNTPKSLKWQILALMNKIKLETCEIKNLLLIFAKNDTGINHLKKKLFTLA